MSKSKYYSESTQPCPGKGFRWDAKSWGHIQDFIRCWEGRGGMLTMRWDSDEQKDSAAESEGDKSDA